MATTRKTTRRGATGTPRGSGQGTARKPAAAKGKVAADTAQRSDARTAGQAAKAGGRGAGTASRAAAATTKGATTKGATVRGAAASSAVAGRQRGIQRRAERDNAQAGGGNKGKPVQAGLRKQPAKMPAQNLRKPGNEHELDLQPRFMAPDYRGSGKLEGMAAIITGGDSGIGRAVAVLFAREGADVAVLYLDEHADAQDTARHVEAEGRRCLVIAGDVKDSAFCRRAVEEVVEAFGHLDVLVNNAAFQMHVKELEDIGDDQLQETLMTNIGGYFHMARAALPHMKNGASIINSGSETGIFGSRHLLDYSATKGAIHAFTQSLASNLLGRGIRVNAVAPGPVWTPLNPADSPAEDVAEFGADSDMGRPAQPEEVSPAYVFLASPVTASYINGVVLPVMGGPRG